MQVAGKPVEQSAAPTDDSQQMRPIAVNWSSWLTGHRCCCPCATPARKARSGRTAKSTREQPLLLLRRRPLPAIVSAHQAASSTF